MRILTFSMTALAVAALSFNSVFAQDVQRDQQERRQQTRSALGQQEDDEQYQARRVRTERSQGGKTVVEALAGKLIKANEAEIELAKLAQQKADNEQIKQLAQTLIQDHQQLKQKLEQMTQDSGQTRGQRQAQRGERQTRQVAGRQAQRGQEMVPNELCQITEQAAENAVQMTKEMLQEHEGQDFQMAFLGQQVVAHTLMLAELRAIESTGPEELQEVAQTAIQKVEGHLEQTKQLAKRFEDESDRQSRR